MTTDVYRIIPNNDPTFNFFEVKVSFHDESISPPHSAEVTVFLEKNSASLAEINDQAIQKAREFLSRIVARR